MPVDFDRFVRSVVTIRNESGGHGYEQGLRTFDCPFCDDHQGRGWLGVSGMGAGCWNAGCAAEPHLRHGAIEWARRVLHLGTRAEAGRYLEQRFGGPAVTPVAPTPRGNDFCRFPDDMRTFSAVGTPMQDVFSSFVLSQWGVRIDDAIRWGLGWCFTGRHAFRVIIPVVMGGVLVGFQARTIKDGVKPKYLTSSNIVGRHTPEAECGRPAAAMLFNADAIRPGRDVLLVEGPGDVMGWHASHASPPAVALMGVALTAEKIGLLRAARPERVIVALDAEPAAQARALAHVENLNAHHVMAVSGAWVGGKDAGAGAQLICAGNTSFDERIQAWLSR